MEIANIINKNTKQTVCGYYLNESLNLDKCVIEIGKPLKIVYQRGGFFTHETVLAIDMVDEVTIKIETVKKIWTLQG